jgi:mono/diheme cytochrome c family protein
MLNSSRILLIMAFAPFGLAGSALAKDSDVAAGAAEYRIACYQCHGEGGKGDGPMAQFLTVKPSDLTQLARKNNGAFPFRDVFQIIDGRATVRAHGEGPMPIWGDRYMAQSGAAGLEPYKSYTAEPFVRARILELTYYVQSIQQ